MINDPASYRDRSYYGTHVAIAMLFFGMVKKHEMLSLMDRLVIITAARVEKYLFLHMNLDLSRCHL
jgi:hypothetical protein